MLDHTETVALIVAAQKGDEGAKETLIVNNMPLIKSIAARYRNKMIEYDDLLQLGAMGLVKAINNFDVSFGVKFSTYAVPMIIGEVRRYLRDYNPIRVSRSLRDTAYKALKEKERLTNILSREPKTEEIAKNLDMTPEEIIVALEAIQEPVSLFEPVFHDGGDTLFVMDQISDNKNKDGVWIENIAINEAMEHLSEREKNIVSLRFFEGKTQMEVSSEVGISQAQVSRLEKNALNHMKKYI